MFCTHCGMPMTDGSRFCAACGRPASAPLQETPAAGSTPLQPAEVPSADLSAGNAAAGMTAGPAAAQDPAGFSMPGGQTVIAPDMQTVTAPGVQAAAIPGMQASVQTVPGVPGVQTVPGVPAPPAAPNMQTAAVPGMQIPAAAPGVPTIVPPDIQAAAPVGYPPAPAPQPPYGVPGYPAQYTQPNSYPPVFPSYTGYTSSPAGSYAPPPAPPYTPPTYNSTAAGVPAYRQRGGHSVYRTPAEEPPLEAVPDPQPEDVSQPLTFWQVVGCYLALFCLPIGNIIFACVWGFRAKEHPQRRMLALAALPFISVGLILLFCVLLWATVNLKTISITLR